MIPKPMVGAPPPVPIALSKLLLAEGNTPTHFCEALLLHLELSASVEVRNFGGVTDLSAAFSAIAATPEFKSKVHSIGIIRDAEEDAAAARQEVEAAIRAAGLAAHLRTSIFILPDNANPGMIETLCMEAVRQHPSLAAEYQCVMGLFGCLAQSGITANDPMRIAKNQAQVYLATRRESQMFPGLAAYRGYWPWECPVFDALKQFLLAL